MIKIGKYEIYEGDAIFYDFEEGIVKTMVNDRATDVKYGSICAGGHSLKIVPITDETRHISKMYSKLYDDISHVSRSMNINWPDLARYMKNLWWEHCVNTIVDAPDSKENLKSINKEFKKFSRDIFKTIFRMKTIKVCDIPLFR